MDDLQLVTVSLTDQKYLDFMGEWGEEIDQIFPHFDEEDTILGKVSLLKKELQIIGLFISHTKGDELHVAVDYVIPKYRDIGIGEFIFENKLVKYKEMGFRVIVSLTSDAKHKKYLLRCGFLPSTKHADWYELVI